MLAEEANDRPESITCLGMSDKQSSSSVSLTDSSNNTSIYPIVSLC